MIIGVKHTVSLLKSLFIELFLNKTDKVSDISDNSVLNATAFGVAKVGQKCLKDIAIVNARIFPDTATGSDLDISAALFGVAPRKGALGSSTYVRVYAEVGTVYPQGTVFVSIDGVRFTSEEPATILNSNGYTYIKVRSVDVGSYTNVAPNTIINVTSPPAGHISCTNEYYAIGGRDTEDDEMFRIRIKNNLNILSIGTREYFTQVFQSLDDRVLKFFNFGVSEDGFLTLALSTQNGITFSEAELASLLENAAPYFPLSDRNVYGETIGIKLVNIGWYIVGGDRGIEFNVDISENYDIDDVRKNIQIAMTKYLDFRYWEPGQKIEWDELLDIVKKTPGVKYVQDSTFYPSADELVPTDQLPRIKRFVMKNLQGENLFSFDPGSSTENTEENLVPIYYSSNYAAK